MSDNKKIMESSTSSTSLQDDELYINENNKLLQYIYKTKPWCLGATYDYCPFIITIMMVIILISVILIAILCIHNRKPYITRYLIDYIILKKDSIIALLLCNKSVNHHQQQRHTDQRRRHGHSTVTIASNQDRNQHSAIHNSIWWIYNTNSSSLSHLAPPSYEESLANNHFKSLLTPIVDVSPPQHPSTRHFNTATVNNAFSIEHIPTTTILNEPRQITSDCVRQQPEMFDDFDDNYHYRENAIDTVELPINSYQLNSSYLNYYQNRRTNPKNLSFMSTDSFQFIHNNSSNSSIGSSVSARIPKQQQQQHADRTSKSATATSTISSYESPPDYNTAVINASKTSSFNKLVDIDNLNKFKKLQEKYKQYNQRRLNMQHQSSPSSSNGQSPRSTGTILSEIEIIV